MTRIHVYDTTLRDGSQGEGVNFSLQDKLAITRRLDELGIDFIEGSRHNPEYALQTLHAAQDAGASVVILCDTNGGTLPEQVAAATERVRREIGVGLGIHCHNDSDVATANTLAAVSHGATQVQGTVNG